MFVNRRGFAPSLLCSRVAAGKRRAPLQRAAHRAPHATGAALPSLRPCRAAAARLSVCGNVDLLPLGLGTQRLERALMERFPAARIARIDRSTQRKGAFAALRDQVEAGSLDILVGTQMLAKGMTFHA